ncbi:ABC transporter permease [Planotetraspora sp. GP83]|uniref:ABC transporter permease n=1 Tax=Planotetraspora sp. GP83 TaxID=3156264 RepID=UPI003510DA57
MTFTLQASLMAGRNLRRFLRSPARVLSALVMPLILMFMMLALLGGLIGDSAGTFGYIGRLAPLIVLSTATLGAGLASVGFYRDLNDGMLDRFRTLPIRFGSVLVGRVAGDVCSGLLTAVVATAVAYAAGFRFTQGTPAALAYFGVFALFAMMMSWVAVLVALAARTDLGPLNALNGPTLLLFFLSSGFVPVENFPSVVRPVVRANPLSVADNAMIGLSSGGPVAVPLLQTLAWTLGVSALCALLAVRRFTARTTT